MHWSPQITRPGEQLPPVAEADADPSVGAVPPVPSVAPEVAPEEAPPEPVPPGSGPPHPNGTRSRSRPKKRIGVLHGAHVPLDSSSRSTPNVTEGPVGLENLPSRAAARAREDARRGDLCRRAARERLGDPSQGDDGGNRGDGRDHAQGPRRRCTRRKLRPASHSIRPGAACAFDAVAGDEAHTQAAAPAPSPPPLRNHSTLACRAPTVRWTSPATAVNSSPPTDARSGARRGGRSRVDRSLRTHRYVQRSRTFREGSCRRARQFSCSIGDGLIGAERASHRTARAQACHETVGELAAHRLVW